MIVKIETITKVVALKRTEIKRTQTLVTETQADAVPTSQAALISTPLLTPATATTSQDNPATPSTAKTFLLLAARPRFNRTTTEASSKSAKSLAAHTENLSLEDPSKTQDNVLPNAAKVQMDLIVANQ